MKRAARLVRQAARQKNHSSGQAAPAENLVKRKFAVTQMDRD